MILVDVSEPENIVSLLRQAIPVVVSPLNRNNIADYCFGDYEGKTHQFGRVQAGELVGNVDSMEDELKRYYDQADETNQIVEGLLSPVRLYMKGASAPVFQIPFTRIRGPEWDELREAIMWERGRFCEDCKRPVPRPQPLILHHANKNPLDDTPSNLVLLCAECHDKRHYPNQSKKQSLSGEVSSRDIGAKMFCYKVQPSGFIEHGHSFSTVRMSELYAWIYRLSQYGVHTYYTNNWEETARLLIAAYKNEQKLPDQHQTFKRIYRPKIYIKHEKNMTPEELEEYRLTKVLMLMSTTYNLGIGEVKAKALAERFTCLMDLSLASVSDISATEGIGKTMAEKILRALGREI